MGVLRREAALQNCYSCWPLLIPCGLQVFFCELLRALALLLEKTLTSEELSQLQELLCNGYWAFECLTVRDYNDMICGICGVAPKVEVAQRSEENVLALKSVEVSASWSPQVTFRNVCTLWQPPSYMVFPGADGSSSFLDEVSSFFLPVPRFSSKAGQMEMEALVTYSTTNLLNMNYRCTF